MLVISFKGVGIRLNYDLKHINLESILGLDEREIDTISKRDQ